MHLVSWDSSFSVNVDTFDEQHKQIFSMLNQVHAAMKQGRGCTVIGDVLQSLISYTLTHFAAEEAKMTDGYPDAAKHKACHNALREKVLDLQKQHLALRDPVLATTILQLLYDWLTDHIKNVDKQYGHYLSAKNGG